GPYPWRFVAYETAPSGTPQCEVDSRGHGGPADSHSVCLTSPSVMSRFPPRNAVDILLLGGTMGCAKRNDAGVGRFSPREAVSYSCYFLNILTGRKPL